ncbi:FAD-dependent oxidoreductase [Planotetraspora sp. A-T 1434]|uniref:NAD(P)/FAD-dependent oxidoreductase n=1 Tax=Planotetraspora sp. A-T 1434 TaxID=2979219 RepID=UPI0021C1394A|nr:FAD-dependent oxidoreductase [Planotetraspora sp. A-T 1434]MCT9933560.1 FAD-dependent oxidoreductase [Planotetraspora sp. A-T 1434]
MSADGPERAHAFKKGGHIVIVGASLAGLRAAETLREEGFTGSLTMIGDEPDQPYDRPPLSKQVLLGMVPAEHTALPRRREIDADWRLGVPAIGLDLDAHRVRLADGQEIGFDRLLIATGVRARPWPNENERDLDGVFVLRTNGDAARLRRRLAARPRRVLVIGAGFMGSEVASACRELGLEVTVAERGPVPLVGALGGVIGSVVARMHREHGVDLRCRVTVTALEGDPSGRLRRAHLSDGTAIDVDAAVVCLGSIGNTEWLAGSGLAAGPRGVACDAGCRAFDVNGIVTDDVFVAGDVARAPNPLYEYNFLFLEHWGNAVAQAEVAGHNMISCGSARRPHLAIPAFWSTQFGVSIRSVGVPTFADEMMVMQGSLEERRFVAAYGHRGRVTAAVAFDQAKWLDFYRELIMAAAPFPPSFVPVDRPPVMRSMSPEFPDPALPSHGATVTITGHLPNDQRVVFTPARA